MILSHLLYYFPHFQRTQAEQERSRHCQENERLRNTVVQLEAQVAALLPYAQVSAVALKSLEAAADEKKRAERKRPREDAAASAAPPNKRANVLSPVSTTSLDPRARPTAL